MKKIVVTVPVTHADIVRKAIGEAGGGKVGKYTFCSFSVRGMGRFLPGEGARPALGAVGTYEEIEEERIEVTCNDEDVEAVAKAIRAIHPYEEPSIDIYMITMTLA